MKEKNSSHCFVRTDLELLVQLFRQFEDKGITDFRELENFLGKNQLANFDDLVSLLPVLTVQMILPLPPRKY